MTIVLDTNVLISGIFWAGPPSQIIQLWRNRKIQFAVSLEIIEEYRRVSNDLAKKNPQVNLGGIIDLIAFNSEIYAVENPVEPICRDPDDDKFLVCATAAKARYIVTGDKDLLDMGQYHGIKILKPGPFVRSIK